MESDSSDKMRCIISGKFTMRFEKSSTVRDERENAAAKFRGIDYSARAHTHGVILYLGRRARITIVFSDEQRSVLGGVWSSKSSLSSRNSQGSLFDRRQTSGLV